VILNNRIHVEQISSGVMVTIRCEGMSTVFTLTPAEANDLALQIGFALQDADKGKDQA
jgi:hypothetical protein